MGAADATMVFELFLGELRILLAGVSSSDAFRPTDLFTTSELQNPSLDVPELKKITDPLIRALKSWYGSVGH